MATTFSSADCAGRIRAALGRRDFASAAQMADEALARSPGDGILLFLHGAALLGLGQRPAAERRLREALASGYANAAVHNHLGAVLFAQGRHLEAVEAVQAGLRLEPHPLLYSQLAEMLKALRRLEEARAALQRALVLDPANAENMIGYGSLCMTQGDLAGAFRFYRRRHDQPTFPWPCRRLPAPAWRGEPLAGRRLLIHAERDFGDTLQFMMFVPQVAKDGGRVILEVQPEMRRLASSLAGVDEVLCHGEALPAFDLHIALPDLPDALGTTSATLPVSFPYLAAPPQRRLGESAGALRIGLVWSGRRGDAVRDGRHCSASDLAPLAGIPGVRLYSLQTGPAAAEVGELAASAAVADLGSRVTDFADTAALLMELDALVSVDTAIVHLAGALGRRVFLLHRAAPAVRWHYHALHRPWYPSLTLVPPGPGEAWRDQAMRLATLLPHLLLRPATAVLSSDLRLRQRA